MIHIEWMLILFNKDDNFFEKHKSTNKVKMIIKTKKTEKHIKLNINTFVRVPEDCRQYTLVDDPVDVPLDDPLTYSFRVSYKDTLH